MNSSCFTGKRPGSGKACTEAKAILPSRDSQASDEPQREQNARSPHSLDWNRVTGASAANSNAPEQSATMNIPPEKRRHMLQWQTHALSETGVAVKVLAPQRQAPFRISGITSTPPSA